MSEHEVILDALAAHEHRGARAWATIHIVSIEQWLRKTLGDRT